MEETNKYELRMQEVITKKQFVLKQINRLLEQYDELEREEEQISDDEFAETGSVSFCLGDDEETNELWQDIIKTIKGNDVMPGPQNLN